MLGWFYLHKDIFIKKSSDDGNFNASSWKGLKFTGLLGLIVAASGAKNITRELALETINKLSSGDFRMSLELYLWDAKKSSKVRLVQMTLI